MRSDTEASTWLSGSRLEYGENIVGKAYRFKKKMLDGNQHSRVIHHLRHIFLELIEKNSKYHYLESTKIIRALPV